MNERDLKIAVNDGHAVIKWPSGYMEQLVPLPGDIIRERANAFVKDRILEIHIPRKTEGELREVIIQ
jgi:adenylate kinase